MRDDEWQDPLIGVAGTKGYPHQAAPVRRADIAARGWNLLRGDLPLPLAVIRRDALAGNLRWMQQFARDRGVELAPHGKTTMSPQLFDAQLRAGAWGITFANVTQARLGLAAGVRRALIANQVAAAADLDGIVGALLERPGSRLLFLVDSLAQLELIEAWWHARGDAPAALEVLLEIGLEGGRTGCRSHGMALALARRLRSSLATRLGGIECYEGLWATGRSAEDEALARGLLQRVAEVALECDQEQLFEADELLVSAGGSAIFDLVASRLRPALSKPVRGVLRSGCYVTHDHGNYKRYMAAMDTRLGCGHGLQAALQVWAMVQSVPEPGLAILTAGKRDCSYDIEMPIPAEWLRRGQAMPVPAPASWTIRAMNDQHAYLRFDGESAPQVGELVGLGISHPCTTFDKWRWMAVVDERYDVVDAIVTYF
jgi:D-serine dehydratase